MRYKEIFSSCKNRKLHWKNFDIFNSFAKNIDCGYTLDMLDEAVLTSTHNLCFGSKIKKIDKPLQTPVFLHKSGVYGGIPFTDMFS